MASAGKLLSAVFLVCIFITGNGRSCELSTVEVQQTNTGLKAGYDTVFEVEVKNLCGCTVTNVSLWSAGFASTILVDPKLFRLEGGSYLVGDGKGIPSLSSFKFWYAWDHFFRTSPANFLVAC